MMGQVTASLYDSCPETKVDVFSSSMILVACRRGVWSAVCDGPVHALIFCFGSLELGAMSRYVVVAEDGVWSDGSCRQEDLP